ncbi:leukocyte elastase inhibitor A-like [Schistocerca serialis cubense]|uniref:leukocyte elastase inhibitor A-like n=1 Tax=Schistocerca serialis cubense TaxID=2023355 RepID=UPI00214F1D3D|nr:leukocyte elastase inhibitor A-like [Schistocerca serialis cubense]
MELGRPAQQNVDQVAMRDIFKATISKLQQLLRHLGSPKTPTEQKCFLSQLTCLVLVNAIYFKGLWDIPFKKDDMSPMPFHVSATQKKTVDMMKLKKHLMYTEAKQLEAQVLKLDYKGSQLSMVILLPKKNNGLKKLEAKLASLNLADILYKMSLVKVEAYLPKFKLEHEIDLRDTLEKLGMKTMFDPCEADLTGISDSQPGLVVSHILHKAFIEVNEKGTEAAAATGM